MSYPYKIAYDTFHAPDGKTTLSVLPSDLIRRLNIQQLSITRNDIPWFDANGPFSFKKAKDFCYQKNVVTPSFWFSIPIRFYNDEVDTEAHQKGRRYSWFILYMWRTTVGETLNYGTDRELDHVL
jgi:hypothetical protein